MIVKILTTCARAEIVKKLTFKIYYIDTQEEQKIIHSQRQDPPLSFSSTNQACEIGSAFCLYTRNNSTAFKVNLDSLSQSKVRVDPRVLLLAKAVEQ